MVPHVNDFDRLVLVLVVDIAVIIGAARLLGMVARRLRQPQVIGEVIAGILLGPSFLGAVAPAVSATLFPPEVLPFLKALSEIGIVLFMFLVGFELDPELLRTRGQTAVVISVVGIAVPFVVGNGLALQLHDRFAAPGVSKVLFGIFMGAAMSVTAFPVLARILIERGLIRSNIGTLVLACAAVDDASGWLLFSVVVALGRAGGVVSEMVATMALVAAYLAVMLLLVRPLLGRLKVLYESRGGLSQSVLGAVLVLVLASAAATQGIGLHTIFGGFMMGAIMPKRNGFVRELAERMEDFAVVFFLPVYFAYTGLRTHIGLLSSPGDWGVFATVMAAAVAGKFGASSVAARALRYTWREAGAIGVLMNTRGLMELVFLNLGLDLGLITPELFAIMVLMAILTTVMTTPILALMYSAEELRAEALAAEGLAAEGAGAVLIPVALSASGPRLLDLAAALAPDARARVYALHVTRPVERGALGAHVPGPEEEQRAALGPLLEHARTAGMAVRPLVLTSRNPADDICEVARTKGVELIVMGWHKPVVSQSVLAGTVHRVMRESAANVAVFMDRGTPMPPRRLLLPYAGTVHDQLALRLACRLAGRTHGNVSLLHVVRPGIHRGRVEREVRSLLDTLLPEPATGGDTRVLVLESPDPVEMVINTAADYELTILGVGEEWHVAPHTFGLRPERVARHCPSSLLIVRGGKPPTPPGKRP